MFLGGKKGVLGGVFFFGNPVQMKKSPAAYREALTSDART